MSVTKVREYLSKRHMAERIILLHESSATVAEAAVAVGCQPAQIAKTLTFLADGRAIAIVTAGDTRIDNKKYKAMFGVKAYMIPAEAVMECVGYAPGGVCPFAVNDGVDVYLDVSLKRFDVVYPAAGDDHSAVRLTVEELWQCSEAAGWVDVCKCR